MKNTNLENNAVENSAAEVLEKIRESNRNCAKRFADKYRKAGAKNLSVFISAENVEVIDIVKEKMSVRSNNDAVNLIIAEYAKLSAEFKRAQLGL